MKHCPVCDERYDEEIIQFCTKDGAPLVDDEQPKFTALPSESIEEPDDDLGEATIIRRKPVGTDGGSYGDQSQPERIIIPTTPASEPHIRPRTAAYIPPPPPPNTAKTVVLTILGTLFILACGAGLFWLLQKEKPATNANTNLNGNFANQNTSLNTNLGFDGNFNFNATANFNTNYNLGNLNANIKSPTPTPKPSPSVSPTPSSSPSPTPTSRPVNANVRPSPTATPRMGPRPPGNTNKPPGNGN